MSQFDATRWFLMPKLRQNSKSVGASPQTPLGELTAPPDHLGAFMGRKGRGSRERTGERGRKGGKEGMRIYM